MKCKLNSFKNDFSNFPLTLLTMPQKFYLVKILLHTPITFEARKCRAYYTCVLQFYPWNQVSKVYLHTQVYAYVIIEIIQHFKILTTMTLDLNLILTTKSKNLLCYEAAFAVLVYFKQVQIIKMCIKQKVVYCQQSTFCKYKSKQTDHQKDKCIVYQCGNILQSHHM